MIEIKFNIPTEKISKSKEGFFKLHPNTEQKVNPAFISKEVTPDEEEMLDELLYTDKQWFTKVVKEFVSREVNRGLNLIARENSRVAVDNDIVE